MIFLPKIYGSGKGGGDGNVKIPDITPDSLQSKGYARFIDLLSEGPIDGFCTQDGVLVQDAKAVIVELPISAGHRIYFSPALYQIDPDDVVVGIFSGGSISPLIDQSQPSSGYPGSHIAGSAPFLYCNIEGDGNIKASVVAVTYPKTVAERTALMAEYPGEFTEEMLPVYPEGRIRGIHVISGGEGYSWATLSLPSASLQSIFFDDRPLGDPYDLHPAYLDTFIQYRLGSEDQAVMKGFDQTEETIEVTNNAEDISWETDPNYGGWKQVISNKAYDYLSLTLTFNSGLYIQAMDSGDVLPLDTPASGSKVSAVGFPLNFYAFQIYKGSDASGNPIAFRTLYSVGVVLEILQRVKTSSGSYSEWVPFGPGTYSLPDNMFGYGTSTASSTVISTPLYYPGVYSIWGKTTSRYEKTIEGELYKPQGADGQLLTWEIWVRRRTPNDDSSVWHHKFLRYSGVRVAGMTALYDLKLTYPFCALIGVSINAQQFSSLPVRSYRLRLQKIEVPTNYFPSGSYYDTLFDNGSLNYRTFVEDPAYNRSSDGSPVFDSSGTAVEQKWDGTFYSAWSNNPAWIVYGILTNPRWGLGRRISSVNKWLFYRLAKYCDELVPTGYNTATGAYTSYEPRFTCNVYYQTREDAWKVLSDIASTFAGFLYYCGGEVTPVADRKRVVRMHFTSANVENGLFTYQGTSRKVRHTMCVVKFNDPYDNFKLNPVVVEDVEGILRYGIQPLEKTLIGVTSRGQARRMARRMLRTELSNTDVVTFTTGVAGAVLRPGDLISVYDETRSGCKFGGRILDIKSVEPDRTMVVTDRKIDFSLSGLSSEASDYVLICTRPLGEKQTSQLDDAAYIQGITFAEIEALWKSQLVEIPIVVFGNDAFGNTTVFVSGSLPSEVKVGSIWGLKTRSFDPQYFSVTTVEEVGKHRFSVTGTEYHEALYAEIDNEAPYTESPIRPDIGGWKQPGPPLNLNLSYVVTGVDGIRRFILEASWSKPAVGFASKYEVYLRQGQANFQFFTSVSQFNVRMEVLPNENYGVRVYAIGITGARSYPAEASITVVSDAEQVNGEIISGLEIRGQGNDNNFYTGDLDVDWRVNWSSQENSLEASTAVFPVLPPPIKEYVVQLLHVDTSAVLVEKRVYATEYKLGLEENSLLTGGPYREFIVKVKAITYDGSESDVTSIRVLNEKPSVPSGVVVSDTTINALQVRFPVSSSPDFAGYRVWMSTTPGFTPSSSNLMYEGKSTVTPPLAVSGEGSVTYYVRYAEFDLLSTNVLDCNISTEVSQSVTMLAEQATLTVFDFLARS